MLMVWSVDILVRGFSVPFLVLLLKPRVLTWWGGLSRNCVLVKLFGW